MNKGATCRACRHFVADPNLEDFGACLVDEAYESWPNEGYAYRRHCIWDEACDMYEGTRSAGMEPSGIVSDARGTVEVGGDLADTDAVFLAWMVKNVVSDMGGRWDVRVDVRGGYGDD